MGSEMCIRDSAWLAAERKELRNHEVHKSQDLRASVEHPSMENGTRARSRLIPLQWIYKSKRDGTKKARLE